MKSKFFHGFKRGMGNFGQIIALIINTVLLAIVYVIGVGITAVFAKIFRKRFLETGFSEKSYWKGLNLKKKPTGNYYRQF